MALRRPKKGGGTNFLGTETGQNFCSVVAEERRYTGVFGVTKHRRAEIFPVSARRGSTSSDLCKSSLCSAKKSNRKSSPEHIPFSQKRKCMSMSIISGLKIRHIWASPPDAKSAVRRDRPDCGAGISADARQLYILKEHFSRNKRKTGETQSRVGLCFAY